MSMLSSWAEEVSVEAGLGLRVCPKPSTLKAARFSTFGAVVRGLRPHAGF